MAALQRVSYGDEVFVGLGLALIWVIWAAWEGLGGFF